MSGVDSRYLVELMHDDGDIEYVMCDHLTALTNMIADINKMTQTPKAMVVFHEILWWVRNDESGKIEEISIPPRGDTVDESQTRICVE